MLQPCVTIAAMRLGLVTAFVTLLVPGPAETRTTAVAPARDPLAVARQLYNERRFDAAITAAESVRSPERADSVDLVVARATLEQFRDGGTADHLSTSRERLRRIRPHKLTEDERLELLVGLGQQLYLEGAAGAAATLFDTLFVDRPKQLSGTARERVLDWWASALDREARPRAEIERHTFYQQIRDRMRDELGRNPGSGVASYWLSASASGLGDHLAAWDAALAGWVRAPLAEDHGARLRTDLDLLVIRVIVPLRARATAQSPDALRQEWEQFKGRWNQGP